jgi:hypothetical protein
MAGTVVACVSVLSLDSSWVRVPMKMLSVARKQHDTTSAKTKVVCFGEEIMGTKATTPKNLSWVPVPVKIVF